MPTVKEADQAMKAAVEATRREFSTVRTGKATPILLDSVRVDAYGSQMPLNQVATVSTPEPTLLIVQPFDQTLIGAIEKAILTADLGLNPGNDGNVIRVPVPPLNEERRREYVKILHDDDTLPPNSLRDLRRGIGNFDWCCGDMDRRLISDLRFTNYDLAGQNQKSAFRNQKCLLLPTSSSS
jgi:ribosome recycling factor